MPNLSPKGRYLKGRRKEYKIMKEEALAGRLAIRSAGSHSPIDVISIDYKHRVIKLIQAKPDNYPESRMKKLIKDNEKLNGVYKVEFSVE